MVKEATRMTVGVLLLIIMEQMVKRTKLRSTRALLWNFTICVRTLPNTRVSTGTITIISKIFKIKQESLRTKQLSSLYSDMGVALFDLLSSLSEGGLQPYSSLPNKKKTGNKSIHCQTMIVCEISSFNLHALNTDLGPNFFCTKNVKY